MAGNTLVEEVEDQRLRVVWQDPATREFHQVGVLSLPREMGEGLFVFEYADVLPTRFNAFLAFPDTGRTYSAPTLFPFFANRVMSAARPEYEDHLAALGLSRSEASPFEMLARTSGQRTTDTVQVVPELAEDPDGVVRQEFLASGVRHRDNIEAILEGLSPGDSLELVDEPSNPVDPNAILLNTRTGEAVGHVPSYMLGDVRKLREERDLSVAVVRVNESTVQWHLRLLCRLEAWPRA